MASVVASLKVRLGYRGDVHFGLLKPSYHGSAMVRLGRRGLVLTKPDQTSISITCPQGLRGGGRELTQLVIADVECCNDHCQTPSAF